MKNLNEETEIFSHDEKIQLNSNSASNQGGNVNSQNSTQLGINNLNQNNKIDISNYGKNNNKKYHITIDNNNINHMNRHGINIHQHHQHNHDFSNPRFLYYYALGYVKYGDFYIQKFFSGVTSSLDMAIKNSSFNPAVKNLIHSKQIFLLIYIINIQYLLSSVEKITFLNFLNQNTRTFMILSIILLYLHYFFLSQRLFIEKDEELEKFIIKRNPQITKGKCEECGLIKIMRSSHCYFCDKCVKKFHLHSDWFNICIGANNELLYAITLFFINLYFFVSNLIFWYYIIFRTDLLSYLAFLFTLFAIAGIYITFISGRFLYKLIFDCLFVNLTWYEKNNIRRLNYLFRDPYGRAVFNPFNKGIQRNLEEMLINMFDINIYNDYKNYNCQDLSELIEEDKTKKEEEQFNSFDDMSSFRLMLRLVEHFDPLITSKENIYKFVDGKEIINWNRLMIFTIFDVINSPFKDLMIKQAKYHLEQREAFLKTQEEKKKKEDEKIDENISNEENVKNQEEKKIEEIKEDKEDKENKDNTMIQEAKEDNN